MARQRALAWAAATLLCASAAPTQNPAGFLFHWLAGTGSNPPMAYNGSPSTGGTTWAHRAGGGGAEVEILNRYDTDDYLEWGVNAQGDHESQGLVLVVQDENIATAESFFVVGRTESAAVANAPDTAATLFDVGPIPMPTGRPAGVEALVWTITLNTPATAPRTADVFYGVRVPASPSWPADGLSTWEVAVDPSATTFDLPGRRGQRGAGIANNTYVCRVPTAAGTPTGPAVYVGRLEQNAFDVLINGAGGVVLATTNQPNYPVSGPAFGGTPNMLSGTHPDTFDFNGTGRADDLGFVFHDPRCAGSPVFVAFAYGPSPVGSVPLRGFPGVPRGSTGRVCLDYTTADFSVAFAIADVVGTAVFSVPLGPAGSSFRTFVAQNPGIDMYWQGLGVERGPGGGIAGIHATGCAISHH